MRARLLAGLLGLAATTAVAVTSASPLTPLPATQGAAAQVEAGAVVYANVCIVCHGAEGEGGEGPEVVGPTALRSFRTAGRLLTYVRLSMPNDAPSSLSDQEYNDVVAYLLDWNGLNPDGQIIDARTAAEIPLTD